MAFVNALSGTPFNIFQGFSILPAISASFFKPQPGEAAAVVPVDRLVTTGGSWFETNDYLYQETNEEGIFLYSLVNTGTDVKVFAEYYDISYDPVNKVFSGIGAFAPTNWSTDDAGGVTSAIPTASNMKAQHWYDVFGATMFSFNNPYYVPDADGSIMSSEPILSTIANTFKIEPVGDSLDGNSWYYSLDGKAFNFTTDAVVIKTYTRADSNVAVTVQGAGGDAFSASINLAYIEPIINSVSITSAYNNINITLDITNPEYGWQSNIVSDSSEVREVTGYQYGLTERFINMPNADWTYHVTGDETVTSNVFTLDYTPPIPPVGLIEPTGGTFFSVNDYKYFETTSAGRFLYGLINQGETERVPAGTLNDVEYDTITRKWYDVGFFFPTKWNEDDGEPLYSVWPTTANLPIQFWYNSADSLQFQFDNPYFASIMTDDPILTQSGDTYTIEPVGDNLETLGWYYSINGSAFNYTTDATQTRSFTVSQTVTVVVQGTSGDELTSSINVIVPWYQKISPTGGTWDGNYEYYYMGTKAGGRYAYSLVDELTTNVVSDTHDVEYDPSDKKWHDSGSSAPVGWSEDTEGGGMAAIVAFPTAANLQTQYWYDDDLYLKFQFTDPYYEVPLAETGYRYLAFYGVCGTSNGWFFELELSTTDGLIDYNNPVPLNKITLVAPILGPDYNNPSCIFDGQYTQSSVDTLIFDGNVSGVLFYMDNSNNIEVQSGSYYTYADNQALYAIQSGKIYGTNTDPTTFVATDEANWNYVCDLTMIS